MGHAPDGRQRLVDDAHRSLAYSGAEQYGATTGDGLPLLLRGGRAVASWSHKFDGDRMSVQVVPFEPGTVPEQLYEHVFDDAARLLGASGLRVKTVGPGAAP